MKLYIYRAYDFGGNLRDMGYFYAKSRDTMRVRIARQHIGQEVTILETNEKPSQMIDPYGKAIGIKLKNSPTYIGKVLSFETIPPTWTSADGKSYGFNRSTGKLYKKRD